MLNNLHHSVSMLETDLQESPGAQNHSIPRLAHQIMLIRGGNEVRRRIEGNVTPAALIVASYFSHEKRVGEVKVVEKSNQGEWLTYEIDDSERSE